ncbi:DNA polymerase kappa isoform X2 [Thalassophryne amazonica]|uniref:DNA polymerase kappa isoform X2 n=1 Tax=Thalassophryne amazonica TaxID=390379 RepID=UPI001471D805|nr:DNA polymerase kappa isoform X2 [Thalassophryne amazonica]
MENAAASTATAGESFLSRIALNDNKAGMEGLDRDKINKIIMETSKGSRFYENELKREQQVNQRIDKMMLQKAQITEQQLKKAQVQVERMASELEKRRDLSRVIVHVDMDAFYAAVEMRDAPELKDKPMAVGSTSMLSTSNYHARKYGVRAAMPGFIAKKLCPSLVIVPTNFDKYKSVSKEIRQIFAEYDPYFQPMSLDEAYLDFTDHLELRQSWPESSRTYRYGTSSSSTEGDQVQLSQDTKAEDEDLSPLLFEDSPITLPCSLDAGGSCAADEKFEIFGMSVEEAVREMRFRIEQKTMLTASAGIAPNMMLAKVCSDKNKPNGQYRLPSTRQAIMDFIQNLPVRKVFGIGKVTEMMLNALGITSCSHLGQQMPLLSLLFSETTWHHFLRVSLGLGSTYTQRNEERKSMSTERTFKELSKFEEQVSLCQELCEALAEDMKKEGLKGKTITLKLKNVNFEVKTRAATLLCAVTTADDIFTVAKDLLKAEIENESPHPLRLRLMGVRISAFVSSEDKKPLQKSIISFLQPDSSDSCGSSQVLHQQLGRDTVPTHSDQIRAFGWPPKTQKCQNQEKVSRLMRQRELEGDQTGDEHTQSFFQRAHAKRLQLQAVAERDKHAQNATGITSEGVHAQKSTASPPRVQESKKSHTASALTQKSFPSEALASTSGCGDTSSNRLTCPVCFRQVDTTDLNVFNRHIDCCLSEVSQQPKESTHTDSELDFDVESDHQGCKASDACTTKFEDEETPNNAEVLGLEQFESNTTDTQQNRLEAILRQTVLFTGGSSGTVTSKEPKSQSHECATLICPVCHVIQDTTDLVVFNRHVDLCLNQEVLHELREHTTSTIKLPSAAVAKSVVTDKEHHLPRHTNRGKTKRRGPPSSPPSKKTKDFVPLNTIDKFFR